MPSSYYTLNYVEEEEHGVEPIIPFLLGVMTVLRRLITFTRELTSLIY